MTGFADPGRRAGTRCVMCAAAQMIDEGLGIRDQRSNTDHLVLETRSMKASSLCFRAAVCLGLVGMTAGIVMAARHNHSVMPAHAHLNLLGWVSTFLMGVYYRLHPSLDQSRVAMGQSLAWLAGTLTLTLGVGMIYVGRPEFEPVAAIGSFIILGAMLLFAVLLFRPEARRSLASLPAAAE
jgi:hypothetical protein